MIKRLILTLTLFLLTSPIHAVTSEATESADINPETIKENIKKRIEQVIKQDNELEQKRVAYIGTLSSVTTNSFSLETAQGAVRQASSSASTTFIDLSRNKEISFEEVSIGDFIAAMGYVREDSKVLDARRVLVLKAPPESPTYKAAFGRITKIDLKKNTLTLADIKTGQETLYALSAKTTYTAMDDAAHKTTVTNKDVGPDSNVLLTIIPAKATTDTPKVISLLIRKSAISTSTPSPSPSPSPSPKVKN